MSKQDRPDDHVSPPAIGPVRGKVGYEGRSGRGTTMLVHLHSQATTTPKVRAAIQASDEPASVLAERYETTEQTVRRRFISENAVVQPVRKLL